MGYAFQRRGVLAGLAAAALLPAFPALAAEALAYPVPKTAKPLKIGVIGSGRIGSMLGELWLRAGHQVMFSDRDPAVVKAVVDRLPGARSGTTVQAAAFGDAVLLAVPYLAMPDISKTLGPTLRGKLVIDTGNPNPGRDGDIGRAGMAKGAGLATAEYLPGAKVVRAFNAINFLALPKEAHRPAPRVATAIGGDDKQAIATAEQLVRDAGFEPVNAGSLAATKKFDQGSGVGGTLTAAELRQKLGL